MPPEAPAARGVPIMRPVRPPGSPPTGSNILIGSEATAIRLAAGELLSELGMSVDPELLDRALTHRSYAYEQGGLPTNERLEFLGDSVLGLIVTEHLFVTYPDLSEGQLAKLRAAVVNSRALADIARKLDLGSVIHLGRGEESTGGRDKSSILADTMEAVIGAVFLQHGIDASRDLVHHLFDPLMAEVATRGAGLDWKTSLQEIASTTGLGVPVYDVVESGPDHAKTFQAMVRVEDHTYGPGAGRNKKEAEQNAAAIAFAALKSARGTGPIPAR
jgi:ribonuclease III